MLSLLSHCKSVPSSCHTVDARAKCYVKAELGLKPVQLVRATHLTTKQPVPPPHRRSCSVQCCSKQPALHLGKTLRLIQPRACVNYDTQNSNQSKPTKRREGNRFTLCAGALPYLVFPDRPRSHVGEEAATLSTTYGDKADLSICPETSQCKRSGSGCGP